MEINYWNCDYQKFEEGWSYGDSRYYCDHPNGTGSCELKNKFGGALDNCTLLDTPGIWWCNHHQREATHITDNGEHKCDPKIGGITLTCYVVFVEGIKVIDESND